MADDAAPEIIEAELDLAHLRDLLGLLTEFRVSGFQAGGLSISFKDDQDGGGFRATPSALQEDDDGHSTSNRRVEGFSGNSFKHPSLWPNQNGKMLRFTGNLE